MNDLIDTVEMYLRVILELEEEGIVPLRARIAERLGHRGPTVSQTVARMHRDGLLDISRERHLELTGEGRQLAMAIMRKHRIAERLLVDIIGLPWELAHGEACRLEHVMSDDVEHRVLQLLDCPAASPYGNPIPAWDNSGPSTQIANDASCVRLSEIGSSTVARIEWIAEYLQGDPETLLSLRAGGLMPGTLVEVRWSDDTVEVDTGGDPRSVDLFVLDGIFCIPLSPADPVHDRPGTSDCVRAGAHPTLETVDD